MLKANAKTDNEVNTGHGLGVTIWKGCCCFNELEKEYIFYFQLFRVNNAVFIAVIIANNNNKIKKKNKKKFSTVYKPLKIKLPLVVICEKKNIVEKSKIWKKNHGEFLKNNFPSLYLCNLDWEPSSIKEIN